MSVVITAPEMPLSVETESNIKLFLAGGITNCPDWQKEIIEQLKDLPYLNIYNPRRTDFDVTKPEETERQVVWEYKALSKADMILFWFSKGSLNPIVLYELGMWGNSRNLPIFIGVDPEYTRGYDVAIQTKLARPDIMNIYGSVEDLAKAVKDFHYRSFIGIDYENEGN